MDNLISLITALLVGMCIWSSVIALADARLMFMAHKRRGSVRRTDAIQFVFLLVCSITSLVVLFVHPGLIYKIPEGIIAIEIASIPLMWYMTELLVKNFQRITHNS